jgi:hypothetical protein
MGRVGFKPRGWHRVDAMAMDVLLCFAMLYGVCCALTRVYAVTAILTEYSLFLVLWLYSIDSVLGSVVSKCKKTILQSGGRWS